jgi:predicted ATP-grasp superfamily ATP-dependent carboligase
MTPVIVLNMHYSGLGIARSLGPHGVPVYGLSSNPEFPGNRSRHCRFRRCPDSLEEPDALCAFLQALARELGERPIVFPTRDHDLQFLSTHRERLEPHVMVPIASREVLERAMNKEACLALAATAGLAVPSSHEVRRAADLESILGGLTFPAIVKPLYARDWRKPGVWETVGHQKAAILETPRQLREFYARIEAVAPEASVQEYIPGPDTNLLVFGSYCRPGGEVRAFFTGRKLLQDPPLKGTGLIVEGLPVPEIVDASRRLLRALDFHGISEIEFKRHERTGVPYLIEINPRHWDQHALGTACGVNLSWEIYRDLAKPSGAREPGADGAAPRQQPAPVRWVAERDLLFYTLRALRHRRRGLLRTLAQLRGRRTYSVIDGTDPEPGRAQWQSIRRELTGRFHG